MDELVRHELEQDSLLTKVVVEELDVVDDLVVLPSCSGNYNEYLGKCG